MTWSDANQRHLVAALAGVRAALERHAGVPAANDPPAVVPAEVGPAALDVLCRLFGLSPFERAVIVLCAGMELDGAFAGLCAAAHGDAARPHPTFGLALAALTDPHWSAVTPAGALRRWRLVEPLRQGAQPLTAAPLRIDERVLSFLTGVPHLDARLAGVVWPAATAPDLVPSHEAVARQIMAAWGLAGGRPPLIELSGADGPSRLAVAAAGAAAAGLRLFTVAADAVPAGAGEAEEFAVIWERESALSAGALYVDADTIDPADGRAAAVTRLLDRVGGPVVLSAGDRWRPLRRPTRSLEVRKPTRDEQRALWQHLLAGAADLNGHAGRLAAQFHLTVPAIRASVADALAAPGGADDLDRALWDAGRSQARPRLEALGQRIEPAAGWDDLALPAAETRTLREIAAHVAQRATVYDAWGFGPPGGRGLGISVLFCGPSGTGKTLAAEVLAGALRLDLYRIDLAGLVSKYIGETEKNLRRVFDAAEDGGAVLFFDEADALFGKRTAVTDSHDRYANIEVNYLLQRMESYRGLVILATNRRGDLDAAFLRRLRFVVPFPFPDAAQRAEIWRRMFPAAAPTAGLDWSKLAQLNVAGGNIRNIAVHAAFLAADAGEPVRMPHLARAAAAEFAKLEKPLADAALGGWT